MGEGGRARLRAISGDSVDKQTSFVSMILLSVPAAFREFLRMAAGRQLCSELSFVA